MREMRPSRPPHLPMACAQARLARAWEEDEEEDHDEQMEERTRTAGPTDQLYVGSAGGPGPEREVMPRHWRNSTILGEMETGAGEMEARIGRDLES